MHCRCIDADAKVEGVHDRELPCGNEDLYEIEGKHTWILYSGFHAIRLGSVHH